MEYPKYQNKDRTNLLKLYENAVVKNEKLIERAEQAIKWLIVMFPSKIGLKSKHVAQGAYGAVNILSLYHKLISLKYQTRLKSKDPLKYGQISLYLSGINSRQIRPLTIASIIEYLALFAELYAFKKGGEQKRMSAIWTIEIVRAITQLRIFYLNGYDVITRHHFAEIPSPQVPSSSSFSLNSNPRQISLSGKRVTKKPVAVTYGESKYWTRKGKMSLFSSSSVPILRSFAEVLHIIRPIITLALMKRFGKKSWAVISFSLIVDLVSQGIHMSFWKNVGMDVRNEISRRNYFLVLYMLWSPLYEAIFGNKASGWIYLKLNKIPIVRNIVSKYFFLFLYVLFFIFYRFC